MSAIVGQVFHFEFSHARIKIPVLIRMFFGGIIWLIVDSMPIFLVMPGIVNDIYEIWYIVLGINICFAIGCLVKGLVSYKTKQFA